MKIYWRKPYVRMQERDYGAYQFAFVVYEKRAIYFEYQDRGHLHPEGQFEAVPVQWKHYLRIDLWIAILDFKWISGESSV